MKANLEPNQLRSSVVSRRIFIAVDTTDLDVAKTITSKLGRHVGGIKIGLEFFNANGPQGVRDITLGQIPFFLDLKFHDIPNTVAGAVRAVVPLAPLMLNVHGLGGPEMLRTASATATSAAREAGVVQPLILAVTVLTSLDEEDLEVTGQRNSIMEQAVRLARLAQDCALDGVVCSPFAVADIRRACGPNFFLTVPGIRLTGKSAHDQKSVASPREVIAAGADYLVIGRAITDSQDPVSTVHDIVEDIKLGLGE